MTRHLVFAYPGDLDSKTGGYGYDRRLIKGLAQLGFQVDLLPLGDGFPDPSEGTKKAAERALSELADGTLVVVDGLAFGCLDHWAASEGGRLAIVALVHHPLSLESGLDPQVAEALRISEISALSHAKHVVVTSPMTARELISGFGIAAEHITIAVPGTDTAPMAPGIGDPPQIISVGTLTYRKGHDVLIDALKRVEDLPWSARIIGNRDLDPVTANALERQVTALGLGDRVTLVGQVDEPRAEMAKADIFALASRYEGYGMVFAEALSQGLPIVACAAGAVPEVVPAHAGILVPADDSVAFAAALRRLLANPEERMTRAAAARLAGSLLPGWNETASIVAKRLENLK